MTTQRSVVKWFDAKKGYGFIVHPQGGADIFVHYSQIQTDRRFRTLRTGQVIEYELHDGPKGLHAINVNLVDEQPALPDAPSAHEPVDHYADFASSPSDEEARPYYRSY